MPNRRTLTEARPVVITEALDAATGVFELQIISPGIGSCGAYPADVIEAAGRDGVFAQGTHLYLDHPTAREEAERPERSVRDLAGALIEAGRWNGEALVAKARVYSPYRELLGEAAQDIGMSIRATATIAEGDFEGQRMPVVQQLHEGLSVDFVTHAGRGGAVLAVLESARAAEAGTLDSERRDQMQHAIADAYPDGNGSGAWVRDFDDDVLYVEVWGGDNPGTFRRSYATDDQGAVTLTGDPVEVVAHTTYVPVAPAAGDGTATESAGGPMPDTLTESEITSLREAAGRVEALTAERDTAIAERDTATRALAESNARTDATKRARARVTQANAALPPAVVDRVVADATRTVPLTEAGALDETALDTATDTARTAEETYLASLRPAGVTGFGSVPSGEAADYITALDTKLDNRIGAR